MHFSTVLAASATLLTLALADPLSFTSWPQDVQAGKPLTLTWAGAVTNQPVTLTLRKGASGNLDDVEVITDQAKDGTFTWTPGENIKEGETYAFQVSQGGQKNYSALLKAGAPANPPASSASETGTVTSAPSTMSTGTATATGTGTGTASQATNANTTTGTSSKPLISSSAAATPSSSAAATTSSINAEATDTVLNGKKSSETGSVQTGLASVSQYSAGLAAGAMALFFYLGF
ncbi:hypothetical protein N7478_000235 [Penicillium angulare]|uniref:uncharacterized protein n=1 Tax=Penicillium angulare TaxID=116970 RepID=UPI00253F9A2F|nr:uncharacterized protein N7478_000235 [Penicillium angulare]KAJ5290984.1 hypothetical protein N7478_000235 [Penicillium angulare]